MYVSIFLGILEIKNKPSSSSTSRPLNRERFCDLFNQCIG